MKKYDIAIIIVTYNTCQLTINCIESVYKCIDRSSLNIKIVLVDNASLDHTSEKVAELFPDVCVIQNAENLGFGKANNIGISSVESDYYFLLNSDTILLNDAVSYFYSFCEKNKKDIGVLGSILLTEHLESNISFGKFYGITDYFESKIKLIGKFRRLYTRLVKGVLINCENPPYDVDYVTGADMFIPRYALQQVGLFDPDFFMYFEETELQYRMANCNLRRIIISGPRIIHLESKSFKINETKKLMFHTSMITYFRLLRRSILFKYLIIFIEFVHSLLRGELSAFSYAAKLYKGDYK